MKVISGLLEGFFQVNENINLTANNTAAEHNEYIPGSISEVPSPRPPPNSPRRSTSLPRHLDHCTFPRRFCSNRGPSIPNTENACNNLPADHLPPSLPLEDDLGPPPLPEEPYFPDESFPAGTGLYEKLHEMFNLGLDFCDEDVKELKSRLPGNDGGEVTGNKLQSDMNPPYESISSGTRKVSINCMNSPC